MANYGEELAYWYLRLNGFFPITNFVIHKSSNTEYPSDCDILAIRTPNVYEEIGGRPQDWDSKLSDSLGFNKYIIGIICEVKTGGNGDIFKQENIWYAVDRLGFFPYDSEKNSNAKSALRESPICTIDEQYLIAKLLIADRRFPEQGHFLHISLRHVHCFIKQRIRAYMQAKVRERIFFNSALMQELIWEVELENM